MERERPPALGKEGPGRPGHAPASRAAPPLAALFCFQFEKSSSSFPVCPPSFPALCSRMKSEPPAWPRGGRGTAGWAVSGVRAAVAAELRREAGALGSQVVAEVAGAWRSRLRRRRGGPAASCSQRGLGVGPPESQRPWQGRRVRPRDRARAERLRFPPAAALSASCGLLARCTGPASPPRVPDPGLVPLTGPLLCVTGLPLAHFHGLGPGRLSGKGFTATSFCAWQAEGGEGAGGNPSV